MSGRYLGRTGIPPLGRKRKTGQREVPNRTTELLVHNSERLSITMPFQWQGFPWFPEREGHGSVISARVFGLTAAVSKMLGESSSDARNKPAFVWCTEYAEVVRIQRSQRTLCFLFLEHRTTFLYLWSVSPQLLLVYTRRIFEMLSVSVLRNNL